LYGIAPVAGRAVPIDETEHDNNWRDFPCKKRLLYRWQQEGECDEPYTSEIGCSFTQIVPVIDALQVVDEHAVACPANLSRGDDVIGAPPASAKEAQNCVEDAGLDTLTWYAANSVDLRVGKVVSLQGQLE